MPHRGQIMILGNNAFEFNREKKLHDNKAIFLSGSHKREGQKIGSPDWNTSKISPTNDQVICGHPKTLKIR